MNASPLRSAAPLPLCDRHGAAPSSTRSCLRTSGSGLRNLDRRSFRLFSDSRRFSHQAVRAKNPIGRRRNVSKLNVPSARSDRVPYRSGTRKSRANPKLIQRARRRLESSREPAFSFTTRPVRSFGRALSPQRPPLPSSVGFRYAPAASQKQHRNKSSRERKPEEFAAIYAPHLSERRYRRYPIRRGAPALKPALPPTQKAHSPWIGPIGWAEKSSFCSLWLGS